MKFIRVDMITGHITPANAPPEYQTLGGRGQSRPQSGTPVGFRPKPSGCSISSREVSRPLTNGFLLTTIILLDYHARN